jgi:membrane protease YdiL (CAAX protease family)
VDRDRPIGWWFGVVFFVAALSFQLGFGLVLSLLSAAGLFGDTREQIRETLFGPASLAIQIGITTAALVLLSAGPVRLSGRSPARAFRMGRPPVVPILVAALAVLPLGFLVDELTFALHALAPAVFSADGLADMAAIFEGAAVPGFVVATVAVTVGPALGEELMFRGLLLRSMRTAAPAWAAVGASALLFGVIHMNALQGAGAFAVGVYLGFAVLVTDSLWTGVAIHAVNNLTCALFSRFDPGGAGAAFAHGHHPAVLVVSMIAVAAAIAYLAGARRGGTVVRGSS